MKKYRFYTLLLAFVGSGARADDTRLVMGVKFIDHGGVVKEGVALQTIKHIRFRNGGVVVEQKDGKSLSVPFAQTGKIVFGMVQTKGVTPMPMQQTTLKLIANDGSISISGLPENREYALQVFDMAGQLIYSEANYYEGKSISTSSFVHGTYLIRINNQTLKFVKS